VQGGFYPTGTTVPLCVKPKIRNPEIPVGNNVAQLLGAATGAFPDRKSQPAPRGLQERKEWQE